MNINHINIKSLNVNEKGYFIAVASNQNVDLEKEVIIPEGIVVVNLPEPFLLEHKNGNGLGAIINFEVKDKEFLVSGYFDLEGVIKSNLTKETKNEIYENAKKGIGALSVGFKTIKSHIEGDIRVLDEIELVEVSYTVNPANPTTYFKEIKSIIKDVKNEEEKACYQKSIDELCNSYSKNNQECNKEYNLKMDENRKTLIKGILNEMKIAEKPNDLKRCVKALSELGATSNKEVIDNIVFLTGKFFLKNQKINEKDLTITNIDDLQCIDEMSEGEMPSSFLEKSSSEMDGKKNFLKQLGLI